MAQSIPGDRGFRTNQETDDGPTFAQRAVESHSQMGFSFVKPLGTGAFGDVLMVKDSKGDEFAAKIVKPGIATRGELHLWQNLKHLNVLPLIKVIHFPELPAYCFQMPVKSSCYETLIEKRLFGNSSEFLAWTKILVTDILNGLMYLHDNGYSHMDLKTNNVLVSNPLRAFLCDFTFLAKPNTDVKSYGAPLHLRPPEACVSKGRVRVDGRAFDLWTLGLLVLDAFTSHLTWELPSRPQNWTELTYPALRQFLKEDFFANRVRSMHSGRYLNKNDVSWMRNFVLMFLRFRPEDRPSVEQALKHKFLGNGDFLAEEDILWRDTDHDHQEVPLMQRTSFVERTASCLGVLNISPLHTSARGENSELNGLAERGDGFGVAPNRNPFSEETNGPANAGGRTNKGPDRRCFFKGDNTRPNQEPSRPLRYGPEVDSQFHFIDEKETLLPKTSKGSGGAVRWIRKKLKKLRPQMLRRESKDKPPKSPKVTTRYERL